MHLQYRNNQFGFSVIELLVAVSFMVILIGVGVPQVKGLMESYQRYNLQSQVLKDLRLAQSEAISQGCRVIFKVSPSYDSYSMGCDYLPYDTDSPPSYDSAFNTSSLPTRMTMLVDETIIFNSKGHVVDESSSLDSRTISLYLNGGQGNVKFAEGTLNSTGVLSYD